MQSREPEENLWLYWPDEEEEEDSSSEEESEEESDGTSGEEW